MYDNKAYVASLDEIDNECKSGESSIGKETHSPEDSSMLGIRYS